MKYSKIELDLADKMYSEYLINGTETKQIAKLFGRKLTNKFYSLLAYGCSRNLDRQLALTQANEPINKLND